LDSVFFFFFSFSFFSRFNGMETSDASAEEQPQGTMVVPIDKDEERSVMEFCSEYIKIKNDLDEIKKRKRKLAQEKKQISEALLEHMRRNDLTCVPLVLDNQYKYLRRQVRSCPRPINESTIWRAIQQINEDTIVDSARSMQKDESIPPRLIDVLVEAVTSSTKQACAHSTEVINISNSKEQRKRKRDAEDEKSNERLKLPTELLNEVSKFHRLDDKLKKYGTKSRKKNRRFTALKKDYTQTNRDPIPNTTRKNRKATDDAAELEQMHRQYQTARDMISSIISRLPMEGKKTKSLAINTDVGEGSEYSRPTYALKEKQTGTRKAFPTSKYRSIVALVIKSLFETCQIPLDMEYSDNILYELSDDYMWGTLRENLIKFVNRYRDSISTKTRTITLDKIVDRKRKTVEEDMDIFESNQVEVAQSDDEDETDSSSAEESE
jgi:hypothetical protein